MPTTPDPDLRDAAIIGGASFIATLGYLGHMLYENKPVPVRKAVGACILTACVGASSAALALTYWKLPVLVVLSVNVLVGFVGGPAVLTLLGASARRWLKGKAGRFTEGDTDA